MYPWHTDTLDRLAMVVAGWLEKQVQNVASFTKLDSLDGLDSLNNHNCGSLCRWLSAAWSMCLAVENGVMWLTGCTVCLVWSVEWFYWCYPGQIRAHKVILSYCSPFYWIIPITILLFIPRIYPQYDVVSPQMGNWSTSACSPLQYKHFSRMSAKYLDLVGHFQSLVIYFGCASPLEVYSG